MAADFTIQRRFLRLKEVQHQVGLGRSAIYDAIAKNQFPKPYSLVDGGRAVGWASDEIASYVDSRIQAGRKAV